ncbi:uncharacterized protein LOC124691132 [Lolium rigidum]|uniref:uncharacterized protein LOC124691132 n=1 Tax=Lolium rigidum TaxID=89674 RepID=UPI001F5D9A02|nr:uncharacterized protein LOC124691132 [Lolium rigidum]
MVHPPGAQPRKRRAAPHAPPPGVMKAAAGSSDRNARVGKRARAAQPSPTLRQNIRAEYHNIINGPPPLGLRLRKSESFLDLLQKILSKANSTTGQPVMDNIHSAPPMMEDVKSEAPTASDRLKASNFPAKFLKIGDWEYTSQYEGDLVAKCYYAKQKLVWEVLHCGLKSKIELQWSDITALKATCPEAGDYGTLDIVLSRPPIFFQETNPQPRKHTLWQPAADFTGGQASMHRRHILRCTSSLLSKNFDKIVQSDQRLYQLSQQPVIILDSPVYESRSSIFENPTESDGPSTKFPHFAPPHVVSPVLENDGVKHLTLKQPDPFFQPMNLGIVVPDVQDKNPSLCNLSVPELRSSISMDDLINHIDSYITEHQAAGDPPLPNTEVPAKELLQIAESLLSDTHGPPSADENYLMARVNSLCCLLEKDTPPATVSISEQKGTTDVAEAVSDDFDGRTADGVLPPVIPRNDSFADLLENLPRVASVSQFLFNIAEDSSLQF